MLEHCRDIPVKAVLAPHDHSFPHRGSPGPPFEHRAEAVRWFDRWLRGVRNGVEDEPPLAVYVRGWHPPGTDVTEIPGRWRFEDGWPVARVRERTFVARANGSLAATAEAVASVVELRSPPSSNGASGMWWGDLQPDQRELDACSVVFDTEPLEEEMEILGFPEASFTASVDAPAANWFARVCDVAPDEQVTLVTGGGRSGAEAAGSRSEPADLEPDRPYEVTVPMHVTSWVFPAGHRIRLSLSTAMWPMVWPLPHGVAAAIRVGGDAGARLILPVVPFEDRPSPRFDPPEPRVAAPGWRSGVEDVLPGAWEIEREGTVVTSTWRGTTWTEAPWGRATFRETLRWRVDDEDPAHAGVHGESETTVELGDRRITWLGVLDLTSDENDFDYRYRREVRENGTTVRRREWHERIPRDHQ
jgi:hypothetical protein